MRKLLALLVLLSFTLLPATEASAKLLKPPKVEKMLKPPKLGQKKPKKVGESYMGPQECTRKGKYK